jgi:3-methyl-2-oxobutanoate hydroxymethyltransferase
MSAQTITRRLTQATSPSSTLPARRSSCSPAYDASFARLLDGAGVEVC